MPIPFNTGAAQTGAGKSPANQKRHGKGKAEWGCAMFRRSGAGVEFLADWQVGDALLRIVAQARQRLLLVSPYNRHWGHLKREVAAARQRGVAVTIYYRADEPCPIPESDGATAIPVRMLHAKIYANESAALVTTMYLLDSSAMHSREVGLLIADAKLRRQVDDYIAALTAADAEAPPPDASKSDGRTPYRNGAARMPVAVIAESSGRSSGFCIACGEAKGFEPDRPLCVPCYARFGRNGTHRLCHRCGESHPAQLNEPLCQPCREAGAPAA